MELDKLISVDALKKFKEMFDFEISKNRNENDIDTLSQDDMYRSHISQLYATALDDTITYEYVLCELTNIIDIDVHHKGITSCRENAELKYPGSIKFEIDSGNYILSYDYDYNINTGVKMVSIGNIKIKETINFLTRKISDIDVVTAFKEKFDNDRFEPKDFNYLEVCEEFKYIQLVNDISYGDVIEVIRYRLNEFFNQVSWKDFNRVLDGTIEFILDKNNTGNIIYPCTITKQGGKISRDDISNNRFAIDFHLSGTIDNEKLMLDNVVIS